MLKNSRKRKRNQQRKMINEILKFDELGGAAKEKFYNHARLLLKKEYITDLTLDELAEKIYNSYIRNRIEAHASPEEKSSKSFLAYDKESVARNPTDKIKEDNIWLK